MIFLKLIPLFLPGWALCPRKFPEKLQGVFIFGISFLLQSGVLLIAGLSHHFHPIITVGWVLPFLLVLVWRRPALSLSKSILPFVFLFCLMALYLGMYGSDTYPGGGDAGTYMITAKHLASTGGYTWKEKEVIPREDIKNLAIRTTPYAYPWKEVFPGFIQHERAFFPQFFPLYPHWLAYFDTPSPRWAHLYFLILGIISWGALGKYLWGWGKAFWFALLICANPLTLHFVKYPTAELLLFASLGFAFLFTYLALKLPRKTWYLYLAFFWLPPLWVKFMGWVLWFIAVGTLWGVTRKASPWIPIGFMVLLAGLPAWWWAFPHGINHLRQLEHLGLNTYPYALVLLFLAFFLFRGALRIPLILSSFIIAWLIPRGMLPPLTRFGGPLLMGIGTLGLSILLIRHRHRENLWIGSFMGIALCFIALGTGDNPTYPFLARRFVPWGLGWLTWGSLYFLHFFKRWKRVLYPFAFALWLLPILEQYPALFTPLYQGFSENLMKLEKTLPSQEPTFFLTFEGAKYASHLCLLEGISAYYLKIDRGENLKKLQQWVLTHPRTYLVVAHPPSQGMKEAITFREKTLPSLARPPLKAPKERIITRYLWEVTPALGELPNPLDVGGADDLFVAGFWGKEREGSRSFRWSQKEAHLLLPPAKTYELTLKGASRLSPQPLRIWLEDTLLWDGFVTPQWQTLTVSLPTLPTSAIVLTLRTHTYIPNERDKRTLGVRVDFVRGIK